jgi:hypothetical protein
VETINNRLDQAEERLSKTEDNIKAILYSDRNKEKIKIHEHNFQEFWDMFKRPNQGIYGVEGVEI